ncbi:MAG: DNA primase [Deltaproteobacteria bacterium]|nr:DNA primase [Deltaproteobacteria bacterium]
MTATTNTDVKEYYRQITDVDIGSVARELLGDRIVRESPSLLECDCPHHQSQSRRSLQITLGKQCWYCFGCGVGGDVLQLVEFVRSGQVTKGQSGPMPESHRQARDYLAEKAGLSTLSQFGLSPEQLAQVEAARAIELRAQGALTALAGYYHRRLKNNPTVIAWLKSTYGFEDSIIDELQIGFAENRPGKDADGNALLGTIDALTGRPHELNKKVLEATGAFRLSRKGCVYPFFDRRLIFPYWSRGRVVFLIGRKTPWTPVSKYEHPKYKKLLTHNKVSRKRVAPCINNSYLYNEDCLLARPERVVITEGVTDCISLKEHGFPVISPVTVRLRSDDIERLIPKLRGVGTVYICQDNEVSQVGLKGALQTAAIFSGHDIETKLAVLPLGEKQKQAREKLKEQYALDTSLDSRALDKQLKGRPEDEVKEIRSLLGAAKIDVNEYFVGGHTAADFEELLARAQTPIEFGISNLPTEVSEQERNTLLEPIFEGIAGLPPLEQDRLLKHLQERYGKSELPLVTLRKALRATEKRLDTQRKASGRSTPKPSAPPGSCRAEIEKVVLAARAEDKQPDMIEMTEAAFTWFLGHGARFFYTPDAEPFMFFQDRIYWMDSSDRGRKRRYTSMIFKETGIVSTTTFGRHFFEIMNSLTLDRGKEQLQFTWVHADVTDFTIYFNLHNENREIAKITPDGVEILKNGGNEDGIILGGANKFLPIKYQPDADPDEATKYVNDLIIDNLTCTPVDRLFIWAWLFCIPLYDFTGTRPMTRFEGPSQSGKSTAAKLITTLLYGEQQQKTSTIAANYTDGAQNPLVSLDNIETVQMTPDLLSFMLTSITGIAKEKRKSGTDTENVSEITKCFINTTGIEPLGSEYSEILTRSLIIRFDEHWKSEDAFIEAQVLAAIKKQRDLILSVMMKRISQVLAMIRDGYQARAMTLIQKTLGSHDKDRCNEYLSLMYLMMLAGRDADVIEHELTTLSPQFVQMITSLNDVSAETARESNPIATALSALFRAHKQALKADRESTNLYANNTHEAGFLERYQIEFDNEKTIKGALARELFIALKRIAKEFNLSFRINTVQQFAQRFYNDLDTIRNSGFHIRINYKRSNIRTYDIVILNESLSSDECTDDAPDNHDFLNNY